jgi:hypothetical protein
MNQSLEVCLGGNAVILRDEVQAPTVMEVLCLEVLSMFIISRE